MELLTRIPIPPGNPKIGYDGSIVSVGSCFAVNMAERFTYFQFRNTVNPFGILFSPDAINKVIGFAVEGKTFTEADLFFHNERWHCFDAHSDLSGRKEDVLASLQKATADLRDGIASASHIIITLGTAWVYRKNDSGNLVANCHKVPQKEFTKELLSPDAVSECVRGMIFGIRQLNPEAAILFTVSPVRHIKDGFVESQHSKSNLISGLHEAIREPGTGKRQPTTINYFPSYEIMMDELRDYRYYAEDMLHPNRTAIDYIWKRFSDAWLSPDTFPVMEEVDAVRKGSAHRPSDSDSESHRSFLTGLAAKQAALSRRFPFMEWERK